MTSYNDVIIPKLYSYIEYIISRICDRDSKGRSIQLLGMNVIDSELTDLNEYIRGELTYCFKLLINYKVIESDGTENGVMQMEIEVPKMHNNLFIIAGRRRISTTELGNDYEIRIYKDNLVIDNDRSIPYVIDNGNISFTINVETEDGRLSAEGTYEAVSEFKDLLKLTDDQRKKISIKLDIDLDTVPENLDYQTILNLINLGEDIKTDSIIDKRFITTEDSLIQSLERKISNKKILGSMREKFYKNGILYPVDIQNFINKFFKVANESSVDIPSDINALVYDSLKNKIILPSKCAYNYTFTDIIDVVNTPENNNVNRINELNKCAKLSHSKLTITCYRISDGSKVELPYLDYLCIKVLSNDGFDYETKKLIAKDEYYYKLRFKSYTTTDISDIEYTEPAPDEKLSITTRRIPLINNSDSVRIAMAAGMAKQSIELENGEPSIVSSGNDEEDLDLAALVTKYPFDRGVVHGISSGTVFIKDPATDAIFPYQIPQPNPGLNASMISYTPVVKVGDVLSKGQPIITARSLRNKSYDLGLNVLAGYMSYLGYTYEDGIVVSQSLADRMAHWSVVDISYEIKPEDIISYVKPIGTPIKSLDALLKCKTKIRVKKVTKRAYENIDFMKNLGLNFVPNDLLVPNNIDKGYLIDCKVEVRDPSGPIDNSISKALSNEETRETLLKYIPTTELPNLESLDIPQRFKELKIIDGFDYKSKLSVASISFKLLVYNPLIKGSKLCNRYGSKGEVSLILPDNEMPFIESTGEHLEMILNPNSIVARKNPSQLYELLLTKIVDFIKLEVTKLFDNNDVIGARKFLKEFYRSKFDELSDEDFIKDFKNDPKFFVMNVGCYSKVSYDQVMEWAARFGIDEVAYVTDPKLGPIESPISVGKTYMMKLYHSADFSGKVTSSIVDRDQPYMGKGLYRDEGQKIGEMEYWMILAHGVQLFIDQHRTDLIQSEYSFMNELLMAGYTIIDKNGAPLLSPYQLAIKRLNDELSK